MLAPVSAYNIARHSFTQQPQRNLRVVYLSILLKLPLKLHIWCWRLLPKNNEQRCLGFILLHRDGELIGI